VKAADLVVTPMGLRFLGRQFPCTIGRSGVTDAKREGDGATPRGTHRLVGMLYRPDRIARPADWAVPIRPGDLWSDDPRDEDYNRLELALCPARCRVGDLCPPVAPPRRADRRLHRPAARGAALDCAAYPARHAAGGGLTDLAPLCPLAARRAAHI